MNPKYSILVPVYNEDENLLPLFQEIETALKEKEGQYEIIFVDDGSTDRSKEIISQLAKQEEHVRAIMFRCNCGQTAAFDAGFRHARGEIIITMDSDLQNDPNDINLMVEKIEAGYDFVAGWRRKRRDGFILRTFPSRIANWIIRQVTRTKLHDLGCSLKVYRKEITDELRLYGEMHRFIGVLIEGLGARVTEVEVNHRPRVAGQSKYNLVRTFKVVVDLITVWFMQGYRTKPSYIFGGTGFLLMGASIVTAMFVLWQKLHLGIWVHRNPVFTISIIVFVIGFQFVMLGLLAELVIRTYFEASQKEPYIVSTRLGFKALNSPEKKPLYQREPAVHNA